MQQSRLSTLALAAILTVSGSLVVLSTPAQSQIGAPKAYVSLQNASPGTSQSGHANISGTVRAGSFIGSGAGLHSLSGDSISGGIVSSEFLPIAVAMEDEGNAFTAPNVFSALTTFNDLTRFNAFTSVGRSSGPVGSQESFGIGESSGGFDGMYVKTSGAGKPYYGYSAGTSSAYSWLDGPTNVWNLTVGNTAVLKANVNGIGLGASPSANSIVKLNVNGRASFNANTSGVDGIVDIVQVGTGTGIQSIAWGSGGIGVLARTGNTTGYGLYADNSSSTGAAAYCFGWGSSSTGLIGSGGSIGVDGASTNGAGVRGASTQGFGVEGHSTSSHGVIGFSTNAEAVVGRTYAANKSSVHGYSDVVGANGGFFWTAAGSGSGVGVIGQTGSASGYGVQSIGRFMATGTKSFRIDHPLDPENKYLAHYCAEGPEPLNVYSGEIRTGSDGYAIVELPEYFGEINRDPRVQLTVDDSSEDFVMAKVVGGVVGNQFRVRTSKPGAKVYWEVKAVRNDLYMQRYGAKAEFDKPARERGTFQHPELYNVSPSRGLHQVDPKLASKAAPAGRLDRTPPIPMSQRRSEN